MFAIENFIEIQVVGFLLLIAISPLLNIIAPSLRGKDGFCPILEDVSDKSAKAVLIIVMAFCVGIAGNRLIDDVIGSDFIGQEGDETYKEGFKNWASGYPYKLQSLKLAEFHVGGENEYARGYYERHKSFMRVLRGSAAASLLLLLFMSAYELARTSKKLELCRRYPMAYFVIAATLFIIFSLAYRQESTHYYRRVCELYTNVPRCEFK